MPFVHISKSLKETLDAGEVAMLYMDDTGEIAAEVESGWLVTMHPMYTPFQLIRFWILIVYYYIDSLFHRG